MEEVIGKHRTDEHMWADYIGMTGRQCIPLKDAGIKGMYENG